MAGTLTPERTAERLCELSGDARAAVLLDAAGRAGERSGAPPGGVRRARRAGARSLFDAVDRAYRDIPGGPPEQVEAQVEGGAVFASRTPGWTLAVVARRAALSSLMLMDLRAVLTELEGGRLIRRSVAAVEPGARAPRARRPPPASRRCPSWGRRPRKEERKGPIRRAAGLAEGFAATMRRMQREREPRLLVYDESGYARLVQPDARGHEALLDTAERMVALVDEGRRAGPGRARRSPSACWPARARPRGATSPSCTPRRGAASRSRSTTARRAPQGGRERGACVRVVSGESTYYGHVDGLAEAGPARGGRLGGAGAARRGRARRRP